MFLDRATIFVRAGRGGDGCVSLRREKYVPKGGPDGGNGGRGGDVTLVGDASLDTLLGLSMSPHFRAGNGRPGEGRSKTGADGHDLDVPVPLGTVVMEASGGRCLGEIGADGERLLVARGGRGGWGNEHFKSATDQTPRRATPGAPGDELTLELELKLIADVGLIGKPNAGKSTLLRAVSRATPKVADYPFTTRTPHLGIAELPASGGEPARRLVIADIPGLIQGAAAGAGMGHDFLRHVERTSILVHVIDAAPADGADPIQAYRDIRAELAAYSDALAAKPEVVAINKIDLLGGPERDALAEAFRAQTGHDIALVSGATGEGVAALLEACWRRADRADRPAWRS